MNSRGFSSQLESGELPEKDHITYEGVFNELTFKIGPKAVAPLELYTAFGRSGNENSLVDKSVSDYLALFLKGSKDGEPRDGRALNAVIILDISGSMGGRLTKNSNRSRMELSKEAIKMFVSKLRDSDAFGLVQFDSQAKTLIPCEAKRNLDLEALFALLDSVTASGGTTLKAGFDEGARNLRGYLDRCAKEGGTENRLVMLTDACDNMGVNKEFLAAVAGADIHTTVVGISEEFSSRTCEQLVEIKGFNYFCAVEDEDLKRHLFANFDFTFFPANFDIRVGLDCANVRSFEVFGTPDRHRVGEYNNFALKGAGSYEVTRLKSSFPSELVRDKGEVLTHGGLVLVKIAPREPLDSFAATVRLAYRDLQGQAHEQLYPLKFELPKGEQFFSEECLAEAVRAFAFVSEMKALLERLHSGSGDAKFSRGNRGEYIAAMESLRKLAPEEKHKEVDAMIRLLKDYKFHETENAEEDDLERKLGMLM